MASQAQDSEAEDEVMEYSVDEEGSDEETYIESLTQDVMIEQADRVTEYVEDPETPEQLSSNRSIKKFIIQTVRNRLLKSFESQLKWVEDTELMDMMKKWKKVTSCNDVEASAAMKKIIKDSDVIKEVVEQHLEELMEP